MTNQDLQEHYQRYYDRLTMTMGALAVFGLPTTIIAAIWDVPYASRVFWTLLIVVFTLGVIAVLMNQQLDKLKKAGERK